MHDGFPLQVSKKEQMFAKSPTNSQYSTLEGRQYTIKCIPESGSYVHSVGFLRGTQLYQRLPWCHLS